MIINRLQSTVIRTGVRSLLLLLIMVAGFNAQADTTVAPEAGAKITSTATLSYYLDEGTILTSKAEAWIRIAEVFVPKLQLSQTKPGVKNKHVSFVHTLENKGNTTQTFNHFVVKKADDSPQPESIELFRSSPSGEALGAALTPDEMKEEVRLERDAMNYYLVKVKLPDNDDHTEYKVELSVTAEVKDSDGQPENLELKNTDTITVVSDRAVLSIRKEIEVVDEPQVTITDGKVTAISAGKLRYRIFVTNIGTSLPEGTVVDPLAEVLDRNSLVYDLLPDEVTVSEDPIITKAAADQLIGDEVAKPSYDYTHAWIANINNLDTDQTVEFYFTANYQPDLNNPLPDLTVANRAYVSFEDDDNELVVAASEEVETDQPQWHGVTLTADGQSAKRSVVKANNTVVFSAYVKNSGNLDSSYRLVVLADNNTFPKDTTFSFTQLGTSIVSTEQPFITPVIPAGEELEYRITAQLPDGQKGQDGAYATLQAIASDNGNIYDQMQLIIESEVPTASTGVLAAWVGEPATAKLVDGVNPVVPDNLFVQPVIHEENPAVEETYSDRSGKKKIRVGLYIVNQTSHAATTYQLNGRLPPNPAFKNAEWTVEFLDHGLFKKGEHSENIRADDLGKKLADGAVPEIAPEHYMKVIAEITVPAAVASHTPGDYNISFLLKAQGATVNTLHGLFSVTAEGALLFGPSAQKYMAVDSIIEFDHTLENTTDTTVEVKDLMGNTLANGWSYEILQTAFLGGQGAEDAPVILPGGELQGDKKISSITLAPREKKYYLVRIKSPDTAQANDRATLQLTARYQLGNKEMTLSATDTAIIQKGSIELTKQVSVDGENFERFITNVKPGETVTWKITAVNKGEHTYKGLVIEDIAPQFTQFAGSEGNPQIIKGEGVFKVEGNKIYFYVGAGAEKDKGGDLEPSGQVEVSYKVKIDGQLADSE